MVLEENNYQEVISALTYKDWEPLFALIPKIENTSKFGEWSDAKRSKEGSFQMPHYIQAPVVSEFLELVYGLPIIINFNWGAWDEGRKLANDEDIDFDTLSLLIKCKLITAIVRNDRFCEGALASAFESGLILRLLRSIEKQIAKN